MTFEEWWAKGTPDNPLSAPIYEQLRPWCEKTWQDAVRFERERACSVLAVAEQFLDNLKLRYELEGRHELDCDLLLALAHVIKDRVMEGE